MVYRSVSTYSVYVTGKLVDVVGRVFLRIIRDIKLLLFVLDLHSELTENEPQLYDCTAPFSFVRSFVHSFNSFSSFGLF